MQAREDRHELGKNEYGDEAGHAESRDRDKHRIDERADHFAPKRALFCELVGEVGEVLAQDPAVLAHADDIDREVAEEIAVLGEARRK